MKDGILAIARNQLLALRCENLSVDTVNASVRPYCPIVYMARPVQSPPNFTRPPWLMTGNPGLSALRLGPSAPNAAVHLLPDGSCAADRDVRPVVEQRERVLNRYCRNPSYSECFAGKTFDFYS